VSSNSGWTLRDFRQCAGKVQARAQYVRALYRDIRCLEVIYVVGTLQHGPQHEMCLGRPWRRQFCGNSVCLHVLWRRSGMLLCCWLTFRPSLRPYPVLRTGTGSGAGPRKTCSRSISAALSQGEHLFCPTGRGASPLQTRANIVGPGKDGHGGQLGHANLTLASGATLDP